MTDQPLSDLSDTEFCSAVSEAFKCYDSLLKLSRSPLAHSDLIAPALVLGDADPTADDRGRALRVMLRWGVARLAPTPPSYPLGAQRPFDDPTWQDPLWWRYNILRHRYLEPLQRDQVESLGYSRTTDALINLTGISSQDTFFNERSRAIREVVALLRRQMSNRQCDDELCRLALDELYQSLESNRGARSLLGLAATFRSVFPRALLFQMASDEGLYGGEAALDYLIAHRLLVEGDGGASLLMPAALQVYVYARQPRASLGRRHERAARFYRQTEGPIEVAWHLHMSGRSIEAADTLLGVAQYLIDDLQIEELREALSQFSAKQLPPSQWCRVQTLLCDLFYKAGERDQALSACRQALNVETEPTGQARLYHRMARLYQGYNPTHALRYYQLAEELFDPQDPQWLDLLKDRAWHYIQRKEWAKAEADLTLALERATSSQRADMQDALADVYRQQGHYNRAVSHAQKALGLREERGDLPRVADSFNNLGLIYAEMGEPDYAIAAYQEALATYRRLGNREAIASIQLNVGAAHCLSGRLSKAIDHYAASLTIFEEIEMPRGQAQAHYNLAEAFASLGQVERAQHHWRAGYALSRQAGLHDQLEWFNQLRDQSPTFQELIPAQQVNVEPDRPLPCSDPILLPEERVALALARQTGWVTSKTLMAQTGVSKATATRRLVGLVERGLLVKAGRGRATRYTLL